MTSNHEIARQIVQEYFGGIIAEPVEGTLGLQRLIVEALSAAEKRGRDAGLEEAAKMAETYHVRPAEAIGMQRGIVLAIRQRLGEK